MLKTNEVTTALNAAEPQSQRAHETTRRRGIGVVSASVASVMALNLVVAGESHVTHGTPGSRGTGGVESRHAASAATSAEEARCQIRKNASVEMVAFAVAAEVSVSAMLSVQKPAPGFDTDDR